MSDRITVWDLPVRVFHWLLAVSFAVAYLVAESEQFRALHVILGYTATGLILFRILWGMVGSHFARFSSFLFSPAAALGYLRSLAKQPQHYIGHNPAGSYAIYGILVAGLATGVTGYLTLKELGGESLEEAHEACANAWLGLVIVHLAGVFIGSWIHRENLVRAMITGYRQGAHGQSTETTPRARPARLVGVALAAGVAAFWIWSLLTGSAPGVDPQRPHPERTNELR
jgi:cytochrome b